MKYIKKRALLSLSIIGFMLIFFSIGCNSNEYLHSQDVPTEVVFNGTTYHGTGKVVAVERIPDEVIFIGQASTETTPLLDIQTKPDSSLDVYSIKGVEPEKAIAIRIILAGTKTRAYYYYRYDRVAP